MKVTVYRIIVVSEEDFNLPAQELVEECLERYVDDEAFTMVGAVKESTTELGSDIRPDDIVRWIDYADEVISTMIN